LGGEGKTIYHLKFGRRVWSECHLKFTRTKSGRFYQEILKLIKETEIYYWAFMPFFVFFFVHQNLDKFVFAISSNTEASMQDTLEAKRMQAMLFVSHIYITFSV
jgi:hypothetical protein